ncbi:putative zinc transporter msc2 [Pichia californica]|uniref:Zinc transporter n=1 Tax=Pichia californica TaxID=460514 RepID=A0A9P6WJK7_9ASCO|nr:putative zinc transporter msc2 [[Candida] californica]
MLFVAIGSMIILIFSQFENKNLNKLKIENLIKDIVSTDLLVQYYKLNYIILNFFILVISFLNESVDPNFTFIDFFKKFFKNNILSFTFNIIILFTIHIETEPILNDEILKKSYISINSDSNTTLFGLFIQMINSTESKSIFNFLLLNIAFMFIQLLYSFRSRSLSLLSDSLHMLLDCTSLFLGLMASMISKNNLKNPSEKYPFGLSRISTLSGFTNGSLLLGIVFGIFNESIQRFLNPVQLENTTELLIVSFLGFLVNLVGIFAFNHGHDHSHGHGHGHAHSHSHNHSHENSHSHSIEDSHNHSNEHSHNHAISENNEHSHGDHNKDEKHSNNCEHNHKHSDLHDEDINCKNDDHNSCHKSDNHECQDDHNVEHIDHDDDNMHGIFLHILADTLGSVGVIISTIIVKITGWNFVDPVASIMIATLILISAIPLLKSSSSNLLLSVNDNTEEDLKYLLNEVLKIPGVKSYTTPRFWPQDGSNSKLVGYLHVQYFRTENSLHIKTNIDRLFNKSSIINNFYLQLENEVDDCWCRKNGIFSTA